MITNVMVVVTYAIFDTQKQYTIAAQMLEWKLQISKGVRIQICKFSWISAVLRVDFVTV